MKVKRNRNIKLFFLVLTLFLAFFLGNIDEINAGTGWLPGHPANSGGAAEWPYVHGDEWSGSGTTEAWKQFLNIQNANGRGAYRVKEIIEDSGGVGFKNSDGTREALYDSCKKSQYIWWYGDIKTGEWFTWAGKNDAYPPYGMGQTMSESWKTFKNIPSSQTRWGESPGPTLVCSGAFMEQIPERREVTLVANSRTFIYDGTKKTVSGLNTRLSKLEKLKGGHRIEFVATKSATNVGSYPVVPTKAEVVDSSGKNVSDQYKITTGTGTLHINPKEKIPDPDDSWRCINHLSDSAKAYVFNTTTGSYGYSPGNLPSTYEERDTPAGEHALNSRFPTKGDTESYWKTWKSNFENGSDEETPELDLEAAGVSSSLSRYGGVYNISRSLQEDTYNVTTCQPQERELETKRGTRNYDECVTDEEGNKTCKTKTETFYYQEWTAWKNDGGRIVWTSSGPSSKEEFFNYQILSVNYNHTGFNSVRSQVGGSTLSLAGGHGGAVLKTPEKVGINNGTLGKGSHITGRKSFYTDGTSIKDAMVCTSAIFPSASNDARNNIGNTHLFTQVLPGNEFGKPNEDGNLIFFRDNEDREVRADLWYPKSTGLSDVDSYSGSQAKETFAKIYGGTPEIELTAIAPWDSKTRTINSIGSEKSWNGSKNSFLMKSQWASDNDKPYEMGVNWEYKATGKNIVPATVDGYEVLSMTGVYSYDFDVYCEFKNSTSEYNAKIPDVPYVNGTTGRMWNPINAIRTLFSRSVSDTTN